jgi:hypothetical protein
VGQQQTTKVGRKCRTHKSCGSRGDVRRNGNFCHYFFFGRIHFHFCLRAPLLAFCSTTPHRTVHLPRVAFVAGAVRCSRPSTIVSGGGLLELRFQRFRPLLARFSQKLFKFLVNCFLACFASPKTHTFGRVGLLASRAGGFPGWLGRFSKLDQPNSGFPGGRPARHTTKLEGAEYF